MKSNEYFNGKTKPKNLIKNKKNNEVEKKKEEEEE